MRPKRRPSQVIVSGSPALLPIGHVASIVIIVDAAAGCTAVTCARGGANTGTGPGGMAYTGGFGGLGTVVAACTATGG